MRVDVVITAYNSADNVRRLVESAVSDKHDVVYQLFLHSRRFPDVVALCDELGKRSDVVYHQQGVNRGLATSWNDGMLKAYREGSDVVIICNDDIVFGEGDLDEMAAYCSRYHENYFVISAWGTQDGDGAERSMAFGCFCVTRLGLRVLGCFDENFFPIYAEDTDYRRRAKLAGLKHGHCKKISILHGGSQTVKRDPELQAQNKVTSTRNVEYYKRKWGGWVGAETHEHPFDAELGLYIAPAQRHHPYGEYDRMDQEIVKV